MRSVGSVEISDLDRDRPKDKPVIKTISGRYVDPFAFTAEDVDIEDIAHALAHQCRYGGAVHTFYSVAEHSMYVARQVLRTTKNATWALLGLLHDADEAYLPDMVRPVKHRPEMKGYLEAGERIQQVVWDVLVPEMPDREWVMEEIVKPADDGIVPWEMAMFRDSDRPAAVIEDVKWKYVDMAEELDWRNKKR